MAREFIDPNDFVERNNIGKVGIAADVSDPDLIVVTVTTHNEKDGTTETKEQKLSIAETQRVYDATCADLNAIESMATACGITLDTKGRA